MNLSTLILLLGFWKEELGRFNINRLWTSPYKGARHHYQCKNLKTFDLWDFLLIYYPSYSLLIFI